MESLYIKLYQKYSKLKDAKDAELEKINRVQEVKFMNYVSAADCLIEQLTDENKKLCQNIDELQIELHSLRTDKEQQFEELQEHLMQEKHKNQQLSSEIEQLRNLQQQKQSDEHEEHANNIRRSPRLSRNQSRESPRKMTRNRARLSMATDAAVSSPSGNQFSESPNMMTRKRARLSMATDAAVSSPSASGHAEQSTGRGLSADHSMGNAVNVKASQQPECCSSDVNNGGRCKCMFQGLVECIIGMKVSVAHQPEGRCIQAMHQSSGYSFRLKWLDNGEGHGELLYNLLSLGTFATVAPEWMREVITFSMSMCPIFFERLSRVIKQC